VFAAKGYASTRVADIVAATDVSQGLLYTYFDSKETLYADLMSTCYERVNAGLRYLEGMPLSARDKVVLALTRILTDFGSDVASRESVRLIAQSSFCPGMPETTRKLLVAEQDKPGAVFTRILNQGREDGSVRALPTQELAELLWGTMKALALEKAVWGADFRTPDVQTIVSLFFFRTTQR
jgi:AcrR family transcriptional regulator